MTRHVLGIDGGGTRTRAAIFGLDGQLLGVGLGGASNYNDVGVTVAQEHIDAAVTAASQAAGVARRECQAVFLGMAGVVSATDHQHIRAIAEKLRLAPVDHIGVHHDCRIALAGGLGGRPGLVVIAGTGSSVYGVNARGEDWMAGGRGWLMTNEGSSYWLGAQALRTAVMAYDGRLPPMPLMDRVLAQLGIAHMDDILHRVYVVGLSTSEVAAFAPLIIEAAQAGSEVCQALIVRGANELADCVLAAARKLAMDRARVEICLVGGLFQAGPLVVDAYELAMQTRLPLAQLRWPELPPVMGAGILALRMAGVEVTATILRRLEEQKHTLQ
jgi:N-acetylglucosamine kinase-like BadF-type ATPase